MPNRTIEVTARQLRFIEHGVESGRFLSVEEVVDSALSLLEEAEQEARVQWLKNSAEEGFTAISRGEGTSFDSSTHLAEFITDTHRSLLTDGKA